MIGYGKEWRRYWRNSSNGFFKAFLKLLEDNEKWFLNIKGFEDGVRNFQDKHHSLFDLSWTWRLWSPSISNFFGLEGFLLLMWWWSYSRSK
jgi:hypothetical protein